MGFNSGFKGLLFYFRFVTVYNIPLKIVFLRTLAVCVLVS